jgi:hypothetical protein
MVPGIEEGRLRFEFDEPWQDAVKWDDSPTYRKGIGELLGTKAVDFLCRGRGMCCFIEVKDFRGYRIENKLRLANGELQLEVAQKVRDTLAGVLGAARMGAEDERWAAYAQVLTARDEVLVVLWLEEDFTPPSGPGTSEQRWKHRLDVVQQKLKVQLRWLTTRVLVTSQREASRLPGVRVRNLPHEP